jgi:hypothetical protein
MSKLAALLIAATLVGPIFAQTMPKAPAMIAGDEAYAPTPEKTATANRDAAAARRARRVKRHKKQAAAAAAAQAPAAPSAPAMIAGDESYTPTPEKAATTKRARKAKRAKKAAAEDTTTTTTTTP